MDPSLPTAQSPLLQQAVLLAQQEADAKKEPLNLASEKMLCSVQDIHLGHYIRSFLRILYTCMYLHDEYANALAAAPEEE